MQANHKPMNPRAIARKMGVSEPAVRRSLGLEVYCTDYRKDPLSAQFQLGRNVEVPAYVIDERERRSALEPRDFTAAQMGDPLPGYSALDQKRGQDKACS